MARILPRPTRSESDRVTDLPRLLRQQRAPPPSLSGGFPFRQSRSRSRFEAAFASLPVTADRRVEQRQSLPRHAVAIGEMNRRSYALRSRRRIGILEFQSAPGLSAGRCHNRIARRCVCSACFNPRPAFRPGDADMSQPRRYAFSGFNPRPAFRPGDAVVLGVVPLGGFCFNPRPAFRPGDARWAR